MIKLRKPPISDHSSGINEKNDVLSPKNLEPTRTIKSPAPIKSTAFKCKHCKAIFKEYYLLENHFKSAHAVVKVPDRDKEKYFKSAHADVKVPDSNKFIENKQTPAQTNKMKTNEPNDGNWKYKCVLCNKFSFKGIRLLVLHMEHAHKQRQIVFRCPVLAMCKWNFTSESDLKSHMLKEHKNCITKCSICDDLFPNIENLNEHIAKVHEKPCKESPEKTKPIILRCPLCKKGGRDLGFRSKSGFMNHVRGMHPDMWERKDNYMTDLINRATRLVNDEQETKLIGSNDVYINTTALTKTNEIQTEGPNLRCPLCQKEFRLFLIKPTHYFLN